MSIEQARLHAARLSAEGIRGIALTWVDNAGITRVKTVPVARLAQVATSGVGMSPVFDVFVVDDSITAGELTGGPDGDLRLFPDLDRLTVLAGQPDWAWAPVDRYDQRGVPYAGCQRRFARRMTELAAGRELSLRMGFETEWVVVRPTKGDGLEYPCTGAAYGMARLAELAGYLGDVLDALAAQGVEVLQLHPEYSPGQFEVSVAPADPVRAADLAVLVRETIRSVTLAHGLTPLFGPAVEADAVGNGGHLHLSVWEGGRNLLADGMTPVGEAFLAGVLRELPALLAVGAPSPASYLRLRPSRWAGVYQCWGVENREAALRFVPGWHEDPGAANAEVKCFDPAANPYLAVGCVIAAGMAGVAEELRLPAPVAGDPAREDTERRLPDTLDEALARLTGSTVLREAMGAPLFDAFTAVRRAEIELFRDAEPEHVAAATRGRY
ncbi:Glutamine synthetase [Streptomyces sp. RB5]|uniref:Glutamine synthetase n=1 Tax=Streptomyces smaragdinus TaxID=2585196 RepID=A0A7K0CAI1_9ACTN|nr:glutamine synthetase family protein [Streptomyces smaragdinus]MQY10460.1 Glutamine synthetase [Streptomyces smaragdinus]